MCRIKENPGLLLILVVLGVSSWPADGNELHVPPYTIQGAIDAADPNANDVVILEVGTHTGPGNRDIVFGGKPITVRSSDPADPDVVKNTIVDCEGNDLDRHWAIKFVSGEGATSRIQGFTIKNAYATGAGAILCDGSSPKIVNCIFESNTAASGFPGGGGAITCVNGASPIVSHCILLLNRALGGGGSPGGAGGAIYCGSSSSPPILHCTIERNTANAEGGAIYCKEGSRPILMHCTITRNKSQGPGQIYCAGASPTIVNCQMFDNDDVYDPNVATQYRGGAIRLTSQSNAIITNSTIAHNETEDGAGGIYCHDSSAGVTNCILWGNEPNQIGGWSADQV